MSIMGSNLIRNYMTLYAASLKNVNFYAKETVFYNQETGA